MVTKNFKNLLALMLLAVGAGNGKSYLPVQFVDGTNGYVAPKFDRFPNSVVVNPTTSSGVSAYGIRIGSDDTPATENDYNVKSQITTGVSFSSPTTNYNIDESGNPYLTLTFVVANSTSSDIVIREIGYIQQLEVATTQGSSSLMTRGCLLDRTVFDSPVTVPAGGSATIVYTLKTVLPS